MGASTTPCSAWRTRWTSWTSPPGEKTTGVITGKGAFILKYVTHTDGLRLLRHRRR